MEINKILCCMQEDSQKYNMLHFYFYMSLEKSKNHSDRKVTESSDRK